ncbi:hypothetical protein ABK040_011641 [Willaertia magna]
MPKIINQLFSFENRDVIGIIINYLIPNNIYNNQYKLQEIIIKKRSKYSFHSDFLNSLFTFIHLTKLNKFTRNFLLNNNQFNFIWKNYFILIKNNFKLILSKTATPTVVKNYGNNTSIFYFNNINIYLKQNYLFKMIKEFKKLLCFKYFTNTSIYYRKLENLSKENNLQNKWNNFLQKYFKDNLIWKEKLIDFNILNYIIYSNKSLNDIFIQNWMNTILFIFQLYNSQPNKFTLVSFTTIKQYLFNILNDLIDNNIFTTTNVTKLFVTTLHHVYKRYLQKESKEYRYNNLFTFACQIKNFELLNFIIQTLQKLMERNILNENNILQLFFPILNNSEKSIVFGIDKLNICYSPYCLFTVCCNENILQKTILFYDECMERFNITKENIQNVVVNYFTMNHFNIINDLILPHVKVISKYSTYYRHFNEEYYLNLNDQLLFRLKELQQFNLIEYCDFSYNGNLIKNILDIILFGYHLSYKNIKYMYFKKHFLMSNNFISLTDKVLFNNLLFIFKEFHLNVSKEDLLTLQNFIKIMNSLDCLKCERNKKIVQVVENFIYKLSLQCNEQQ